MTAARYSAAHGFGTFGIAASWDRLLQGPFGHDDAWLLLPAVVAAVWLLVLRRRRPRTDLLRAAVILWSAWLVLTFGFFSGIAFVELLLHRRARPPRGGALRHGRRGGVAPTPDARPCGAGWPR